MAKKHIVPLTSIRGLAAVVVAFAHCGLEHFWPWVAALHPYCWGNQAVDLFFVLSAFVLLHNYGGERGVELPVRDYLAARVARIYPLHVVTMIFVGLLAIVAIHQGRITGEYKLIHVLQQLLLMNAWPLVGMERTWNYPAWSISIEWFLYLFILPPLVKNGPLKSKLTAALAMLLPSIAAAVITAHVQGVCSITSGWFALLRGVCGFLAGWGVWSLYTQHRAVCHWLARWCDVWMFLSFGIVVAAGLGILSHWCLLPCGPVLIASMSVSRRSLTSRWMHSRVMVFLGEISYALYMTHAVVAKALNATLFRGDLLTNPAVGLLLGGIYIGGVLLIAWLVYRFFEVPARSFLRKRLAGRNPAPSLRLTEADALSPTRRHEDTLL